MATWSHHSTRRADGIVSRLRRERSREIDENTPAIVQKQPVFKRNRLTGEVTHYPKVL